MGYVRAAGFAGHGVFAAFELMLEGSTARGPGLTPPYVSRLSRSELAGVQARSARAKVPPALNKDSVDSQDLRLRGRHRFLREPRAEYARVAAEAETPPPSLDSLIS